MKLLKPALPAFKSIQQALHQSHVAFIAIAVLTGANAGAQIVWNGASGVDNNWSTAGNWAGGLGPTATDSVRFNDDGADFTPGNVNNTVNALFGGSVAALQYSQSNSLYHTTLIDAGQTLTVLGNFVVGTEAEAQQNIDAAVTGTGTLVVSNTAAEFIVRQGGNGTSRRATLDLSGLDTLIVDVDRVLIGRADPPGYPNINRNTGWIYLAKTNYITAETANSSLNVIGIEVGRSGSNNGNGSRMYLGQTNVFFASSLGVGIEKETGCQLLFNSIFAGPTAYIRGEDGTSRMNLFAIGEGEANSGTTSCQGTADFTGGTVDAQVNSLVVGRASSNTGGTGNSRGTLTFDSGIIDVNTAEIGVQRANTGKNGNGVVNVNGGTLIVNGLMEIGVATGGAGVATTVGTLNITSGTVQANTIASGAVSGGSTISVTSGTLVVTNSAGALGAPINNFTVSDSILQLESLGSTARIVVNNLTTGGAGNTLGIGLIPAITAYPVQYQLVAYQGSIAGSGFNFTLTGLPGAYTGYLSNNTADASVDLVLVAGPVAQNIFWTGTPDGNWNSGTFNWRVGAVSTNFFGGDFVNFDDTATGTTAISLNGTLRPGNITVNNSALAYTFGGSGKLSGLTGLTKDGSGLLLVTNTGANDFLGAIAINDGTVQLGAGGTTGNLPPSDLANDGLLVVNRSDDVALNNNISGAGSLTKNAANTLALGGANSFSGTVTVVAGILQAGSATALGAIDGGTIINNGATLDVNNLNLGLEPVTVSGAGVGGLGAIVENTGNAAFNAPNLAYVTLTGDTVFGGTGRWDLRSADALSTNAALSTGGQPYRLTKVGANSVALVGVQTDPALGDIDIQEGLLGLERATTTGNPASNLTVREGATLSFFQLFAGLNKQIQVFGSGTNNTLTVGDGTADQNFVIGPMQINGECWMHVNGGDFMTFSNVFTGGASHSFIKVGDGTLTLSGPTKTYSGNTTISNGTLVVNCLNNGGGTLTSMPGTTLAGNGTNSGPVVVGGTLAPGTSAGTFGAGGLTLEAGATVLFELNSVNTMGGGVNDLLQVNGDLVVNGNSFQLNLLNLTLQAGTYRLINYTGSLIGELDTNITLGGASRYGLSLDTNTVGQVNLIVTGGPNDLVWASTASTAWDIGISSNWFNTDITAADAFFQGDNVLLDDTIGVATSIDIADAVAPATLTIDSTNNFYLLNGPGKITGGGSIVKRGDSTLFVNSTNDFTGPVTIQQGILQLGNNSALGSTVGSTIISNGATLDIGVTTLIANQVNIGVEPIVVSGAGVNGLGAIVNNTLISQQNAVRVVTLTGNTTLGGNGRWDVRGAGASLSTEGNAYNLTKTGNNQISFVGVAVDPAFGNVDVQQGTFSFETSSTAGDPTRTFAVQGGAVLQFFNLTQPLDKRIALTNASINNDSGANNIIVGPVVMDGFCTLDVDGGSTLTLSNTLSGVAALNKVEAGTLNLTDASFVGDTTISAGTIALLGNAVLAGSPNINVNAGGLDVSGRVDGRLNLLSGQTLSGNGTVTGDLLTAASSSVAPGIGYIGRLSVSGGATLGGLITMDVDKFTSTNDVLSAGSLQYGGTLQLINFSEPYGAGNTFKLFSASSYAGAFTTIDPATPGAGLVWDTSNLAVNGTLRVASAAPLPPPDIVTFTYTGLDVTLSGTNGPAYGTYQLLTTTDAAQPVANWTVAATGYFDVGGNFSVNLPVNASEAQRYFVIRVP